MFATAVCAGFLCTALAADPVAAVQQRFPVVRTTITTATGSQVVYTLPADAPPELRRAYKGLEIAEREVLTSEALQKLELEVVNNERKLENLRTYYLTYYLQSPNTQGPQFYGIFPFMPESSLRRAISWNVARPWAADRATLALDRLAFAQFQLQQVLNAIAHPGAPGQLAAPVPADNPAPLANPVNPVGGTAGQGPARQAEQAAAKAEALAEKRERAARQKDLEAEAQYRASLPEDRAATRQAWLDARAEWEQARRNWDAARKNWEAARDRLDSQPSVPATPSARPTTVRSYLRTTPVVRSQPVVNMPAPYPLAQPAPYYVLSYRPPLSVPLMTIKPLR